MEKIIHLTDTHLFADGSGELRGTRTSETLSIVLEQLRQEHADADAFMVTGDLVQEETDGAYQHFIQFFSDFDVPVLCLPGNHDAPEMLRKHLSRPPFRLESRVAIGDWNIIQLDSHLPGSAAGLLGEPDRAELETLLAEEPNQPTLVAIHHPPIPVGTPWLDGVGLKDGEALLSTLERFPQVHALIWGHVHQASRSRYKHLELIGTPSTCAQFLPGSTDFAIDPDAPPAYRVLWLHENGKVEEKLVEVPLSVSAE